MNVRKIAAVGLALTLSAGAAMASESNQKPAAPAAAHQQTAKPAAHKRMSQRELKRLEAREAAIRSKEERMKAEGKLTANEQRKLDHEISVLSHRIRAEKHRA